jgi:hypothetical protein
VKSFILYSCKTSPGYFPNESPCLIDKKLSHIVAKVMKPILGCFEAVSRVHGYLVKTNTQV